MRAHDIANSKVARAQFEWHVMRHLNSGFNLACWILRNEHDAEDVVQDSVLKAWKSFEQFQGDDGKPWFLKIVRNGCYRHLEKRKNAPIQLDEDVAVGDLPDESVLLALDIEQVQQAIHGLPEFCREVLILREMEQMSYSAISELVGVPIGTVMSRLSRARAILAKTLAEVAK